MLALAGVRNCNVTPHRLVLPVIVEPDNVALTVCPAVPVNVSTDRCPGLEIVAVTAAPLAVIGRVWSTTEYSVTLAVPVPPAASSTSVYTPAAPTATDG